jgi:hypothetical protein
MEKKKEYTSLRIRLETHSKLKKKAKKENLKLIALLDKFAEEK